MNSLVEWIRDAERIALEVKNRPAYVVVAILAVLGLIAIASVASGAGDAIGRSLFAARGEPVEAKASIRLTSPAGNGATLLSRNGQVTISGTATPGIPGRIALWVRPEGGHHDWYFQEHVDVRPDGQGQWSSSRVLVSNPNSSDSDTAELFSLRVAFVTEEEWSRILDEQYLPGELITVTNLNCRKEPK